MNKVTVMCECCQGKGTREVTGKYAEALHMVRRARREVTGAELARIEGCKPTAMNMRLAALERIGLLVSRRYGRLRLYRPA
jgi:hypothetical protein